MALNTNNVSNILRSKLFRLKPSAINIAVLEKNKTAAEYAEIKIIDFFPSLRKL